MKRTNKKFAPMLLTAAFAIGLPSVLALVPALVPTARLQEAVALNAAGINVARAVGPILGGVMLAFAGAGWCFLVGTAIFSGCLFALALSGIKILGAVVPIGGVLLIAGWMLLAYAGWHATN